MNVPDKSDDKIPEYNPKVSTQDPSHFVAPKPGDNYGKPDNGVPPNLPDNPAKF